MPSHPPTGKPTGESASRRAGVEAEPSAPMTAVPLFVGMGPLHEASVRHYLGQFTSVQVIDAETDTDAALALSPPLFPGTHVHVRNVHSLTDAQLREFAERAGGTEVSAEAAKLTAAARRIVTKHLTVMDNAPKKGAETTKALDSLASELGVSLSSEVKRTLTHRNSTERAYNILRALASAGINNPDERLVTSLSSQEKDPSVPWTLTAAIDKRDSSALLSELQRAEAIPIIAYFAKRAIVACLASEGADTATISATVPGLTEAALRDGAALARRSSPEQLRVLASYLAEADVHARTGNPQEALTLSVAAWTSATSTH